jgi:hypothetical protein
MPNKTQLVIAQQLTIEEHLFAGAGGRDHAVVSEHAFVGPTPPHRPVSEHVFAGGVPANPPTPTRMPLKHPHLVSSVTVERRSDGSLFLTLDE